LNIALVFTQPGSEVDIHSWETRMNINQVVDPF